MPSCNSFSQKHAKSFCYTYQPVLPRCTMLCNLVWIYCAKDCTAPKQYVQHVSSRGCVFMRSCCVAGTARKSLQLSVGFAAPAQPGAMDREPCPAPVLFGCARFRRLSRHPGHGGGVSFRTAYVVRCGPCMVATDRVPGGALGSHAPGKNPRADHGECFGRSGESPNLHEVSTPKRCLFACGRNPRSRPHFYFWPSDYARSRQRKQPAGDRRSPRNALLLPENQSLPRCLDRRGQEDQQLQKQGFHAFTARFILPSLNQGADLALIGV